MKLAKREKYLVTMAACALGLFLIFELLVFPFFEERDRLRRGIEAKKEALEEMAALRAEYQSYESSASGLEQRLDRRRREFTLFSFLDRAAGNADIKDQIKSMKPSASEGKGPYKESMVEMKLEMVTLKQLLDYLYRIELPEQVIQVKRISIKKNKKELGYLDAILQVLTLERR